MALVLVVLFLVVPIAELAVVISVGGYLGIPETIVLMIAISVAGAVMAKRQGLRVLRAVQDRLHRGEVPGKELTDGLLVLVAAVLLLTPGFLTDALALLLLVPFVRGAVRAVVRRAFEHRVQVVTGPVRGWVVDSDARPSSPPPRHRPPEMEDPEAS